MRSQHASAYFYLFSFFLFPFLGLTQSGGETCATATVIPSIPFVGTGSTVGANDDYFEVCADVGNLGGAPDHVYSFANGPLVKYVNISLCEAVTNYDSQLYVYENTCGSNPIACQEDGCQSPAYNNNYNSRVTSVLFQANTTYYIVIDGYGGSDAGNYQLNVDLSPMQSLPDSSEIPLVYITTVGGQGIPDDPKLTATMQIINNGAGAINYATDPYNEYNGFIAIERRGSSSQMFPKKSYGLETRDSLGTNNNVSLFGMPSENDWILHGPYSDKSLLRNYLAYSIGSELNFYSPRTQFCELIVNGTYLGVYLFMEKIKKDSGRVDIATLDSLDIMGDQLTGGYILKIDKSTGGSQEYWTSPYQSQSSNPVNVDILIDYPKTGDIQPQQRTYIENYVTAFENSLASPQFTDPFLGYRNLADINSFVDYLILSEATRNVDGYRISTYFIKNKESKYGKLRAGPPWDYNLGFGNANYCAGENTAGWAYEFNTECAGDNWQVPFWWERMLEDPEFQNRLRCRWEQLRSGPLHTDSVYAQLDSISTLIQHPRERNFLRWDILGDYVWPNFYIGNDYDEELNYLKYWIGERFTWLDQNFPGNSNDCTFLGQEELEDLYVNVFPNPFSSTFYVEFESKSPDASVSITDMRGVEVWSTRFASSGLHTINSSELPELSQLNSGAYIIRIVTGEQMKTVKLIKTN